MAMAMAMASARARARARAAGAGAPLDEAEEAYSVGLLGPVATVHGEERGVAHRPISICDAAVRRGRKHRGVGPGGGAVGAGAAVGAAVGAPRRGRQLRRRRAVGHGRRQLGGVVHLLLPGLSALDDEPRDGTRQVEALDGELEELTGLERATRASNALKELAHAAVTRRHLSS